MLENSKLANYIIRLNYDVIISVETIKQYMKEQGYSETTEITNDLVEKILAEHYRFLPTAFSKAEIKGEMFES